MSGKRSRVARSKRRNRHRVIHDIARNIQAIQEGPERLAEAGGEADAKR